jgi:photosystem II CP43 chlorophyll apoprotein
MPHLTTLGLGSVVPGGDVLSVNAFFVVGSLHLIGSSVLALGGIFHATVGPELLEESAFGWLFGFQWQDRYRVTSILGAHLVSLSVGAILLVQKGILGGGLYDTWALGGGDVRCVRESTLSLSPFLIVRYLIRAPFGGEGSIVSVDNIEDLLGGH